MPPFPHIVLPVSRSTTNAIHLCLVALLPAIALLSPDPTSAAELSTSDRFLKTHCYDCHSDGAEEGGFSFEALKTDVHDEATFAKWERLFDRIETGEMPPKDADPQPSDQQRRTYLDQIKPTLIEAHASTKGTVLRRLNRREYANTLNDMFGTNLDLDEMLPEDGRSHEFDTVGDALGLSMVHLQRYLDAIRLVLDTAIAKTTDKPKVDTIVGTYKGTGEGNKFIGTKWKELTDGAIVRFQSASYPTGMMRSANVQRTGRYRVRVEGYAYQSDKPITFSVGGTSFARGSEKPIYGYFSFKPGQPGDTPQAVEFEAWIEERYMIQIEPYGINDPNKLKQMGADSYDGPGLAIHSVTLEGPLVGQFPSRGHQLVLDGFTREEVMPRNPKDRFKKWYRPKFELTTTNETTAVTASLLRVAEAAFRRPVSRSDIQNYRNLYDAERADGSNIEDALRTAVSAIFCSPRFLYFQEESGRLDDFAVADRLSYFLSRTAPDEELRTLAERGRLASSPTTLREQVDRLLEDDRFERFISDFTDSWLDLREMDFTIPDRKLFPEFDPYLRWSMPLETQAFVRHVIVENRPIRDLVAPDYAMLNSRLAEHYGLPPVTGSALRPVPLPRDAVRGGLLAHASIHKVTANGTNSSPVTRGAWVMERILGETPPPPPPGVPGVEPDIRGASTLRELLDKHRDQPNCVACHQKIDPPGFALEEFNPIGGSRDRYRSVGSGERVNTVINGRKVSYKLGPEVDSSGQLLTGERFDGFRKFRDLLAAQDDVLAETFVEKLLTFATGREMGFSDREEIAAIAASTKRDGYRIQDLLHAAVASNIFRSK